MKKITAAQKDSMYRLAKQAAAHDANASFSSVNRIRVLGDFAFLDGQFCNSFEVGVSNPDQGIVHEYLIDVFWNPTTAESYYRIVSQRRTPSPAAVNFTSSVEV